MTRKESEDLKGIRDLHNRDRARLKYASSFICDMTTRLGAHAGVSFFDHYWELGWD